MRKNEKQPKPDIPRLRELLSYDPTTGLLTWLPRKVRAGGVGCNDTAFNNKYAGKVTNYVGNAGHIYVTVEGHTFLGHRIAWALHYGEWPPRHIDHKNRNPADNRIENLRLATGTQNSANSGMNRRNKSGVKGVFWNRFRGKWQAIVGYNGKLILVGSFDRMEDAVVARQKAANEIFGEFANEIG